MSEHGGRREGAGRKPGSPNRATAEVRDLALEYGPAAVKELARLGGLVDEGEGKAQSEGARVQACNALIERAYGKALPGRCIQIDLPDTSTVEGVTKAVASIVQAAASGNITPGEASDLCGILDAQRRAIELSVVETRLAALEASQGART